jgi:cysteine desulfurase/selenocysteine lyase
MPGTEPIAVGAGRAEPPALDPAKIRRDFPILEEKVHGKPLVYLDNAATTQKPIQVLDALRRHYGTQCSNVHRGVHYLSQKATVAYEGVRQTVRSFINAEDAREIVFVRSTTEAINLVAQTFGRQRVGEGDEILLTGMEHHSNIVPWQMLAQERNAHLRVVPLRDDGSIALDRFEDLLSQRTRLVAVVHVSNALGTVNPIREMVDLAHRRGVPVLVDGAQAVPHQAVDVRQLGCDFYAFSGHKMYGPTGIGVLYGRLGHLETMPPYQGGGDMIASVTFEKTTFNRVPHKFEAGTPNIAGSIGLGAAIDYLRSIGMDRIRRHEDGLLEYATAALSEIPRLRLVGTAPEKTSVLSFTLDDIHPHDIGTILDMEGIAVRAGHHCAQPVMDHYGIPATARASLGIYNTRGEVDVLAAGLRKVLEVLG